jgi:hypothetical protein
MTKMSKVERRKAQQCQELSDRLSKLMCDAMDEMPDLCVCNVVKVLLWEIKKILEATEDNELTDQASVWFTEMLQMMAPAEVASSSRN